MSQNLRYSLDGKRILENGWPLIRTPQDCPLDMPRADPHHVQRVRERIVQLLNTHGLDAVDPVRAFAPELAQWLRVICADTETVYNELKNGSPVVISIGMWGRLDNAKKALAAAGVA